MHQYLNRFFLHSNTILHRLGRLIRQPIFIFFTLILHGSLFLLGWLFYLAERNSNLKAQTFFDCIYWAFTTLTTVGYGDIVPVTSAGKCIAIVLMIIGSVVAVLYTALFAAALMSPELQAMQNSVQKFDQEVKDFKDKEDRIKQLISELNEILNRRG